MSRLSLLMVFVFALASRAMAGPIHNEGGAGRLPSVAELVPVAVTHIRGQLQGNPFRGGAPPDFEDVYLIYIEDTGLAGCPNGFSASTEDTSGGFNGFDTQLWLFDGSGFGLLGNDDVASGIERSRIAFPSTDTSPVSFPGPGFYYLAISGGIGVSGTGGGGDDPTAGGLPIFDFTDNLDPFQISGPDGSGGFFPIDDWSATGLGDIGTYDIAVECVVPEPAVGGFIFLSAILAAGRRRNRNERGLN